MSTMTVVELFAILGGDAAVRELLDVAQPTVNGMKWRNRIPPKHHRKIARALPRPNEMPDELFRQRDP